MTRAPSLVVLILATGACGAESWSFDYDASAEDTGAAASKDAPGGDDRPSSGDADHESPSDATLLTETGPPPEAAPRCAVDGDCPSDAPLCIEPAGQCVRCSADVDCVRDGGPSVCKAVTGACVQCIASSDCSSDDARDCDTTTNRCVRCLNSAECPLESVCEVASGTCTKMF